MTVHAHEAAVPDDADAHTALTALPAIERYLRSHPGPHRLKLSVEGEDEPLVVPRAALELLARILSHMAAGEGVSVVPAHAELTTRQAADLLNVSRPYLIGLLDAGEIAYRKVGTHRRITASSLLSYLQVDDQRRRAVADELSAMTRELGLA